MMPPTIAQQHVLAYAPKPFAAASFVASCYMIYYLVHQEPAKLQRLYNRLVLAMNVALLPASFACFWGDWASPAGTPDKIGAVGTVSTCTAQGFIQYMFMLTVDIYYGSFMLQALVGVRRSFKEETYAHIEKWIHAIAYIVPGGLTAVLAATENFNPAPIGCWDEKVPYGCDSDATIDCQRGQDVNGYGNLLLVFLLLLLFVLPPWLATAMYRWIKKSQEKMLISRGIQKAREAAKKQMMQSIAKQIGVYLLSFWCIYLFNLTFAAHRILTGEILWNLVILGSVVYATQGLIFAVVYFALQRTGRVQRVYIRSPENKRGERNVKDIRSDVERKLETERKSDAPETKSELSDTMDFNIFDGSPDENSPWAQFIDPDCSDDEVDEY